MIVNKSKYAIIIPEEKTMNISIFDNSYDNVLKSAYFVGKTTLKDAYEYLVPIINRFKEQRFTLKSKVYEKLKVDIEKGCIMPPLTIAFKISGSIENAEEYIKSHISEAFVLDGIQRLNTINRVFIENENVSYNIPIYLNILFSDSMDKLLYRMVTLNNGQKPMSTRHQIEILASNLYNFDELPLVIQTEKEQKLNGREELSFTRENIIKAYIAFISNSYMLDNQKIIDEKMDELITNKIMEANITDRDIEFSDVMNLINKWSKAQDLYKWFNNTNNMIGFCASVDKCFKYLEQLSIEDMSNYCKKIDEAISSINRSKINLGSFRRKSVNYAFNNLNRFKSADVNDLLFEIGDL